MNSMHRFMAKRLLCHIGVLGLLLGAEVSPCQRLTGGVALQSWSTDEGLPQNSVHAILQTDDGFLWVATEGGLARFDGLNFRVFQQSNEPAFISDDISCLAEDGRKSLWIGTADG